MQLLQFALVSPLAQNGLTIASYFDTVMAPSLARAQARRQCTDDQRGMGVAQKRRQASHDGRHALSSDARQDR